MNIWIKSHHQTYFVNVNFATGTVYNIQVHPCNQLLTMYSYLWTNAYFGNKHQHLLKRPLYDEVTLLRRYKIFTNSVHHSGPSYASQFHGVVALVAPFSLRIQLFPLRSSPQVRLFAICIVGVLQLNSAAPCSISNNNNNDNDCPSEGWDERWKWTTVRLYMKGDLQFYSACKKQPAKQMQLNEAYSH